MFQQLNTFLRRSLGYLRSRTLRPLRDAVFGAPPASPAPAIQRLLGTRAATVVQVGSCDGKNGDPISELFLANEEWDVLFIEPLPHVFKRLLANYQGVNRFRFANVAIDGERAERTFYFVSDAIRESRSDVPYWYDQLGSFDPKHIEKHAQGLSSFMETAIVKCEPLAHTLASHGIEKVDLLHIDTEGHDYEILKQVDFDSLKCRCVLYEHKHLSPADKKAAKRLLRRNGFRITELRQDTLGQR